ncbi:MAG: hypothetical protein Unbinned1068contig1001_29 [Prokaryotic dsDNA virus sp.]|nr:MAG: hypothetical protein Unbinned1068contig1001_29 [Prokaryotic dsDNA virus sp.]|tara:strand:- start:12236 stop:13039 length:804 start_codon:yes stop_codon:yes gene_type:complete
MANPRNLMGSIGRGVGAVNRASARVAPSVAGLILGGPMGFAAAEGTRAILDQGAPGDFSARGSARQRAAASVAQRQRDELRQRGISEYGDLVGAYEGAEQRAQEMLGERQRLAESTIAGMGAQALGGLGGMRGGGGAATMAGVGEQATREAMRQKLAGEQLLTDRQIGAREAAVQRTAFEQEAGSIEREYSQALNEGDADIQQAIDDSQGEFWDDTDGMTRKIRSVISRVRQTNPQAAAELERQYLTTDGKLNKRGVGSTRGSWFGG